jgi:hypothetical protein
MPTPIAAPSFENYTVGASRVLLGATDIGNVIAARISPIVQVAQHYDAHIGGVIDDPRLVQTLGYGIEITVDEPDVANIRRFFLADGSGNVGLGAPAVTALTIEGIVIVGNKFDWVIPRAVLTPQSDIGYGDDDWMSFQFFARVLWDKTAAGGAGFGTVTHTGVV